MNFRKKYFCSFLLIYCSTCWAIEPVSTGLAVGAALTISGFLAGYETVKCIVYECCDSKWINPNLTALAENLTQDLHGQHLVRDVVTKHLRGHINDDDPKKALVFSFHGWTGGGKNFVSKLIVNSLFEKGDKSSFVHLFVAPLHFPHESHVETYKDQLHTWIKGNVTKCERSLFIFDEMDKMPAGLIDAIKPFLDYHQEINGVNYRKTTFIFLSNTAGTAINEKVIEHWRSGKRREELAYKEMEELIIMSAFNEKGGLWHSSLITQNLISAFVPFLPLERVHIKKCISDEIKRKGYYMKRDLVDSVADELHYFPSDIQIFSKSGCKKVSEKVDFVHEEL